MGTTPSKMGPEAFDCIIEESKRGSCLPASATSTTVWIRSEGHGGASRASTASERVTPASPKCSSGTSKGKDLLGVPSKDSDCNSRNGSRGAIDPKNPVHGKDRQLASRGDGGGSTNRGFGLGAFTAVNWRGLLASGNEGEGECSDRGDGDRGSRDSEGTHELDDISAGEKSSGGDDVCWWDTEGEEDKEEEDDEEEEEQGGEFDNSSSNESRGDSRGSRDSSTASQGVSADSDSSWSSASSGARSGSSGSSGPRSGVSRRSTARAGVGSSSARSSRAEVGYSEPRAMVEMERGLDRELVDAH